MQVNGEFELLDDDEIRASVELFKKDHYEQLRLAIQWQRKMFEQGRSMPEIAAIAATILRLEEIVKNFTD